MQISVRPSKASDMCRLKQQNQTETLSYTYFVVLSNAEHFDKWSLYSLLFEYKSWVSHLLSEKVLLSEKEKNTQMAEDFVTPIHVSGFVKPNAKHDEFLIPPVPWLI